MAASSSGFTAHLDFKPSRFSNSPFHAYSHGLDSRRKKRRVRLLLDGNGVRVSRINCCCSDSVVRRASGSGNSVEKPEEKRSHRSRFQAIPALPFPSHQSRFGTKQEKFYPRCTPRNTGPQSRDTPPKRDTGIANEKDMGINLLKENVSETGTNEDGSTWFRESGEDLGENGYRCRWTKMGGRSHDDSTQWEETVKSLLSIPNHMVFCLFEYLV